MNKEEVKKLYKLRLQVKKLEQWYVLEQKTKRKKELGIFQAIDQAKTFVFDLMEIINETDKDSKLAAIFQTKYKEWHMALSYGYSEWNKLTLSEKMSAESGASHQDVLSKVKNFLKHAQRIRDLMHAAFVDWLIHILGTNEDFLNQFVETFQAAMNVTEGGQHPFYESEKLDKESLYEILQEKKAELQNFEKEFETKEEKISYQPVRFPKMKTGRTLAEQERLTSSQVRQKLVEGDHSALPILYLIPELIRKIIGLDKRKFLLALLAVSIIGLYFTHKVYAATKYVGILSPIPILETTGNVFAGFDYIWSAIFDILSLRGSRDPNVNPLINEPSLDQALQSEANGAWSGLLSYATWCQAGMIFANRTRKAISGYAYRKLTEYKLKSEKEKQNLDFFDRNMIKFAKFLEKAGQSGTIRKTFNALIPLGLGALGAIYMFQFVSGQHYRETYLLPDSLTGQNLFFDMKQWFWRMLGYEKESATLPFDSAVFQDLFTEARNTSPKLWYLSIGAGIGGEVLFYKLWPSTFEYLSKNYFQPLLYKAKGKEKEDIKRKHRKWTIMVSIISRFLWIGARTCFWSSVFSHLTISQSLLKRAIKIGKPFYIHSKMGGKLNESFHEACMSLANGDKSKADQFGEEMKNCKPIYTQMSGFLFSEIVVQLFSMICQMVLEIHEAVLEEPLTEEQKTNIVSDVASQQIENLNQQGKRLGKDMAVILAQTTLTTKRNLLDKFQEASSKGDTKTMAQLMITSETARKLVAQGIVAQLEEKKHEDKDIQIDEQVIIKETTEQLEGLRDVLPYVRLRMLELEKHFDEQNAKNALLLPEPKYEKKEDEEEEEEKALSKAIGPFVAEKVRQALILKLSLMITEKMVEAKMISAPPEERVLAIEKKVQQLGYSVKQFSTLPETKSVPLIEVKETKTVPLIEEVKETKTDKEEKKEIKRLLPPQMESKQEKPELKHNPGVFVPFSMLNDDGELEQDVQKQALIILQKVQDWKDSESKVGILYSSNKSQTDLILKTYQDGKWKTNITSNPVIQNIERLLETSEYSSLQEVFRILPISLQTADGKPVEQSVWKNDLDKMELQLDKGNIIVLAQRSPVNGKYTIGEGTGLDKESLDKIQARLDDFSSDYKNSEKNSSESDEEEQEEEEDVEIE